MRAACAASGEQLLLSQEMLPVAFYVSNFWLLFNYMIDKTGATKALKSLLEAELK